MKFKLLRGRHQSGSSHAGTLKNFSHRRQQGVQHYFHPNGKDGKGKRVVFGNLDGRTEIHLDGERLIWSDSDGRLLAHPKK